MDEVTEENNFNMKHDKGMINIKRQELEKVKKVGQEEKKGFSDERQVLENKYHELLEDNIKRDREENNEVSKKKFKLADLKPKKKKNEIESSAMEEEDINDRTPILDVLIDKWKSIIKTKKAMIERYRRNVYITEISFEKICNVLIS